MPRKSTIVQYESSEGERISVRFGPKSKKDLSGWFHYSEPTLRVFVGGDLTEEYPFIGDSSEFGVSEGCFLNIKDELGELAEAGSSCEEVISSISQLISSSYESVQMGVDCGERQFDADVLDEISLQKYDLDRRNPRENDNLDYVLTKRGVMI